MRRHAAEEKEKKHGEEASEDASPRQRKAGTSEHSRHREKLTIAPLLFRRCGDKTEARLPDAPLPMLNRVRTPQLSFRAARDL